MDSPMEIFALKDAFWKLTARVAVIENIISEKFGDTAFSVVHKQLSMTNSGTNKTGQNLGQSQTPNQKSDDSASKTKLSVSASSAVSKRKSTNESNTHSSPSTDKRRRSKRVNYNEDDDDENSAAEGTSSNTAPELATAVSIIKIEDDDDYYDSNEDDNYPELSPVSNDDQDANTNTKNLKPTPKRFKNRDTSEDAMKRNAKTSFTEEENLCTNCLDIKAEISELKSDFVSFKNEMLNTQHGSVSSIVAVSTNDFNLNTDTTDLETIPTSEKTKKSFASYVIQGATHDVILPEDVEMSIIAQSKERRVISILLRHYHDVKALRNTLLTGKRRVQDGSQVTILSQTTQKAIIACCLKLFPLHEIADPVAAEKFYQSRLKVIKGAIGKCLQYYKNNYDDAGRKIKRV